MAKPNTSDQNLDLNKIFENYKTTTDEDSAEWLKQIRDKLYNMFRSPMKEEFYDEAFKWVSHLCISIGDLSWISPDDQWNKDEAKIFSCISRLSMNEIHILLPYIMRHLTYGEKPELEDSKIMARSANSADYDRFGMHLVIIESVIKSLVKGQGLTDDETSENKLVEALEAGELRNLLERLKEIMGEICNYLELVYGKWEELLQDRNSERFSSTEGSLRIISVWLSEDPGAFEPQCKRFLIKLLVENLLLPDRLNNSDILILALHSVCTNSQEMLDELHRQSKYKESLDRYLRYVNKSKDDSNDRRSQKMFKLRCGLIKDLLE